MTILVVDDDVALREALEEQLRGTVIPIIRHHHERWDGSGYPSGLKGEAIPPEARIMAVVDVYDALRTRRSYKDALSHQQAMQILLRETETGFWDPSVVATLLEVVPRIA